MTLATLTVYVVFDIENNGESLLAITQLCQKSSCSYNLLDLTL